MENKIVAIRIRGPVGVRPEIEHTMSRMRLHKKHHAVIVDEHNSNLGMLWKAKDFITWGEISSESFENLLLKRGRLPGGERFSEDYIKQHTKWSSTNKFVKDFMKSKAELVDIPNLKPVFRLSPPRKGFERKGIKQPFTVGGAIGYRGEKINLLLKKML